MYVCTLYMRVCIYVYCFGHATPTQGSSANDLRNGQRIVGNKNNRKRKERMWPTLNGSVHNFIGRVESIVPEVNKVNGIAGQNVSVLGESI